MHDDTFPHSLDVCPRPLDPRPRASTGNMTGTPESPMPPNPCQGSDLPGTVADTRLTSVSGQWGQMYNAMYTL